MKITIISLKKIIKFLFLILFLFALVAFPNICIKGAQNGLKTSAYFIIPSTLPFMIVTKYIINSNSKEIKLIQKLSKFTNIPYYGIYSIILGSIAGYPTGAILLNDQVKNNKLSPRQAESILPYTNNCSPLFIIGTVGVSILSSKRIGYILYVIHIASAFLYGIINIKKIPINVTNNISKSTKNKYSLSIAVRESATGILNITAYVVLFSVICELISTFSTFKNDLITSILCGLTEISGGCIMISITACSPALKLSFISFIISLSGLCIILQTADVLIDSGISIKKYIIEKMKIAIISFTITYILFSFYPPLIDVFNDCSTIIKNNCSYIFWMAFIPSVFALFIYVKK